MPELRIVWRNPNPQLRVARRRVRKCELSPEFYNVQELVSPGDPGLWLNAWSLEVCSSYAGTEPAEGST